MLQLHVFAVCQVLVESQSQDSEVLRLQQHPCLHGKGRDEEVMEMIDCEAKDSDSFPISCLSCTHVELVSPTVLIHCSDRSIHHLVSLLFLIQ